LSCIFEEAQPPQSQLLTQTQGHRHHSSVLQSPQQQFPPSPSAAAGGLLPQLVIVTPQISLVPLLLIYPEKIRAAGAQQFQRRKLACENSNASSGSLPIFVENL
jgi:hypothetical protein